MGKAHNRSYAARAMLELAVEKFPECFTRNPSTWTRSYRFTNPVETGRPLNYSSIYNMTSP